MFHRSSVENTSLEPENKMETRANHFAIGMSVLALIASGFGFLYWMKTFGGGTGSKSYAILFPGPVNGVVRGTAVLFNGVRVGRVDGLSIDAVDTTQVRITVAVAPSTPVRQNTRARIARQGLTGGATIELTAGTTNVALLPPTTGRREARILADSTGAGGVLDAAPKVLGNADTALDRLNEILLANSGPIRRTIGNIEAVSGELAANKGEISGAIRDVRRLTVKFEKIEPLLDNAQALVARLDKVVTANETRLIRTLDNVEAFTRELSTNKGDIKRVIGNVKQITTDLQGAGKVLKDAGRVVTRVDALVDTNAERITKTVGHVEAFTASLDRNRGNVDAIFKDVKALSLQLKLAATKMERTLDKVGTFMGSDDGASMITDARDAIASIKRLSVQFEDTFGKNAQTLTRSTKRSLAELELFMRDGRRLTRNLDRVLDGFDRNPQRLLFGGSPVPEYNPQ